MSDLQFEDYIAIKETIKLYIKGGKSGKTEIMEKAFHKNATIYGWIYPNKDDAQNKIEVAGPIELLYDIVDDMGPALNLEAEFVRIDIVGFSANVRLELYNWNGIRFTDTLNLIKKDDNWLIVNKIFNQLL